MLTARREGVICLLPSCPGGVVSNCLQGAGHYPVGEGFFSIFRGRARGGRVKRKRGVDFPDKAAAAAPSHLPAQGMSPLYLQVVCTCGAAALPAALAGGGLPFPTCCGEMEAAKRRGFSSSSHLDV